MDAETLTRYLRHGILTVDQVREELGRDPWALEVASVPGGGRCSYCRFLASGDRCRNCGAPQ